MQNDTDQINSAALEQSLAELSRQIFQEKIDQHNRIANLDYGNNVFNEAIIKEQIRPTFYIMPNKLINKRNVFLEENLNKAK